MKVEILESLGGYDSEGTFQYQKGDIVDLSKERFKGIKGAVKVLEKVEKRPLKAKIEKR